MSENTGPYAQRAQQCNFIYKNGNFFADIKQGDQCDAWTYRLNGYCDTHKRYSSKRYSSINSNMIISCNVEPTKLEVLADVASRAH